MRQVRPHLAEIEAAFPAYSNVVFLAEGGQKFVLRANARDGTAVAVKLIAPGATASQYFSREVATVRKLALPFVPEILDAGDVDLARTKWHYIVERYIEGQPLNDFQSGIPMQPEEVHALTQTLLRGCALFESENVVHRDIKPRNIIRAHDGSYWIIDFGVVRVLDAESVTATAQMRGVGTVAYQAPESIRNRKPKIDGKSDLFSAGLTIYEAIHGSNPHVDGKHSILGVLRSVEETDLAPLVERPGLDRDFLDFVASLCNRRRTARPASAARALEIYRDQFKLR